MVSHSIHRNSMVELARAAHKPAPRSLVTDNVESPSVNHGKLAGNPQKCFPLLNADRRRRSALRKRIFCQYNTILPAAWKPESAEHNSSDPQNRAFFEHDNSLSPADRARPEVFPVRKRKSGEEWQQSGEAIYRGDIVRL